MERKESIIDVLPQEILTYMILMLQPKELSNTISTCKYLKEIFRGNPYIFKHYTLKWLGIINDQYQEQAYRNEVFEEQKPSISFYDDFENCIKVLQMVSKRCSFPLCIEGYYTNGGVCLDMENYEVFHTFNKPTGKVFSSTLPSPIVVSGVHRPIQNKLETSKELIIFSSQVKESEKYDYLMWIFEELTLDHENPRNIVDILIEEAIIDYGKYRTLIKEIFPNIGHYILKLHDEYEKVNDSIIKHSRRIRPIPGYDSPNLVEYEFSNIILKEHKGIDYLACFKEVKVVQPINYTCPVKTLALFVHNQPLESLRNNSDACDRMLNAFSKCVSIENVYSICNQELNLAGNNTIDGSSYDQFIRIKDVCEYESQMDVDEDTKQINVNCDLITFNQDTYIDINNANLMRPVAWIQMKNKSKKAAYIQLLYVSGRFVTALFINVENLSLEITQRFDPSENVDVAAIQIFGHSIPSILNSLSQ